MKKRKARRQSVYIGCDKPFNQILVPTAGVIALPDDGNTYHVFHQLEYDRVKKPKVVYALFQFFGSRSICISPMEELKKYDSIYAVDTNYKKVAVTTAIAAVPRSGGGFSLNHLYTEPFVPSSSRPEREGWKRFVDRCRQRTDEKICLVVDSDLGLLTRINKREEPIVADSFLPSNWQLNYATSDTNDSFLPVRMIRACDKLSRAALRKADRHRS